MQLETHTVIDFFGQLLAIEPVGTFVRQLRQVVGLELDAVQLVVTAQFLDFLLALLARQRILAVLVAGELLVELFLAELMSPLFLRTEVFGDGEEGHDGVVVDAIDFDLVENLAGIAQCLGDVGEDVVHLLAGLEPLLLGVEHAGGIVEVLARREAQQVVVSLGVLLVDEVRIVGADELDAVFVSQLYEHLVGLLLQGERLAVGTQGRVFHLVALQLQVVVVSEDTVIPFDGLAGSGNVAVENLLGHLAGNTCRADDEALVVFLQILAVCSGAHVEAVDPRIADQLDKILVTLVVFGQYYQVVAALVPLVVLQQFGTIA